MSNVTDILTGRINLKRLTSYLIDGITPSYANAHGFDRNVVRSSRMEVEIVGASIPVMGTIIIEGNNNAVSINEYVVQDRVLLSNWAIGVQNGTLTINPSAAVASNEPIIEDGLVGGSYWRLFISDGMLGVEDTLTAQDDEIILKDSAFFDNYMLSVSLGVAGLASQIASTEVLTFTSNGVAIGTINFDSLSQISSYGIVGGSIFVRAVSNIGQPINQYRTIAENMPVRFYAQSGRIRMLKQGQDKIAKYKIMAEPDADVQDKDMVYTVSGCFGLTYGQIDFVEKFYDFDGVTHHTEAEIVDL